MGKTVLHIILLFTLFSQLHSQQVLKFKGLDPNKNITQYTHDVWTADNGLPQSSVTSITQTPDGYLWVGTQEGLVRFDGVRFTVFDKSNTPAIHNNYISTLLTEKETGKLWIGTYGGGVSLYFNGEFSHIDTIKELSNSQIQTFYIDTTNALWIGTRDYGAVKIDSTSVTTVSEHNGLVGNDVWKIMQDTDGRMWFATEAGISVQDGSHYSNFTEKNGLISKQAFTFLEGHNNVVWVGTPRGLLKVHYNNDNFTVLEHLTEKDGLPGNGVYAIKTDNQGNLWLAMEKGVGRIYKSKIESFTTKNGLSERLVNTVFVDREGNLWIGTEGGGLNILMDGIFTSYTTKEGMPNNIVWTVLEDNNKLLWFGTDEGLAIFERGKGIVKTFSKKDNLSHYIVWSLAQDSTGAIWAGTINGLNKIVNQKVVPLPPQLQFKNHSVSSVLADRNGSLWVGTADDGLHKITGSTVTTLNIANGSVSNYINCIAEDKQGTILAGTDGQGLILVKNDTVQKVYTTEQGLGSNYIHSLYVSSDGIVWIGTFGGGLSILHDTTITTVNMKNGLFNDVIYQILEDDYGRLWMSCNKGVFQIEKNELVDFAEGRIRSVSYRSYGKKNGMKSEECNGGTSPAGWKSSDGHLWFPTTMGVTTVDPKKITINQQPPLVVLEGVYIDNTDYALRDAGIIPPGKQRIEFHYTGLSFDGPNKIKFKVLLEGYDREWYNVGTRRTAYFSHIPPGEYTFRVLAANADGVWNTTGASFPFVVQAQFYQTKIFYFVVVVLIALGIYGTYRWRTRQIVLQQKELSAIIELRTKDLLDAKKETENLLLEAEQQKEIAEKANTMKTQLLYIAAHDLKSPLISIEGLAKEITLVPQLDNHSFELSKMIRLNASRMISLIADLLNLSAIESGKLRFHFETVNVAEIAALVISGYEIQAQRKQQALVLNADPKMEYLIYADSTRIQEAIENLLSNSIKYSPKGMLIQVGVEKHNDTIRISVHDDGPGFSESDKSKIFKRFQKLSAQPTGGEISTGLGLAIVKEIVEAHRGTISLESNAGKGSTFYIDLPAANI